MSSERPVILNLPPVPSNLSAPSPPWNPDLDDIEDDSKTESGQTSFTTSETGTETYSLSYASTNYGDFSHSHNPRLFVGQASNLDASALLALAKSSSPLLPLLQLEDGDTYIFLTPARTSHNPAEKLIRMRYAPPMRVPSARLLATKSAVFKQLLSESMQRRIIMRLVKQKKLIPNMYGNPLPAGIKYAIDLTPEEEGEQAVEWIERLWCPDEVMEWHSLTEPLPSTTLPVASDGETDFLAIIKKDEEEQKRLMKKFSWENRDTGDKTAPGASGDTVIIDHQDENKEVKVEDVSDTPPQNEQEQQEPISPVKETPKEEMKVQNYSFARHLLSLERLIHIIHNLDPMVSSTPDWYTLHCLSVYFGTTDATRDYTAKWIYSNYPTIVEQHPNLVWKVAIEAGLVSIAADAWSSALMGIGTSIPNNPEALPGVLEGRKAFEERVETVFNDLFELKDDDVRGRWIEEYIPPNTDTRPHVIKAYDEFASNLKLYIFTRLRRLTDAPAVSSQGANGRIRKMEKLLQRQFWLSLRDAKIWNEANHVGFEVELAREPYQTDLRYLQRVNEDWHKLEGLWKEMEGEGEVDMMEMMMKEKMNPRTPTKRKEFDLEKNEDENATDDDTEHKEKKWKGKERADRPRENIAQAPTTGDEMEFIDDNGDVSSQITNMKESDDGMDDEWDTTTIGGKSVAQSVSESVVSDVSAIRRATEQLEIMSGKDESEKPKITSHEQTSATTLVEDPAVIQRGFIQNATAATTVETPQRFEPMLPIVPNKILEKATARGESPKLKVESPPAWDPTSRDNTQSKTDDDARTTDMILRLDVNPKDSNPFWLTTALVVLRKAYFNGDEFWGVQVPRAAPDLSPDGQPLPDGSKSFHRIICKDCPEKMYFTGPGESADNFEKHLLLPLHRQRVNTRVASERYKKRLQEQEQRNYDKMMGIASHSLSNYDKEVDNIYNFGTSGYEHQYGGNNSSGFDYKPYQSAVQNYNAPSWPDVANLPPPMTWSKDLVHILNTCQYHVTSAANSMLEVNVDFDLLLLEERLSCLDETERRFMPLWAGGEVTANEQQQASTSSQMAPGSQFLSGDNRASSGAAFPSGLSTRDGSEASVIGEISTLSGASTALSSSYSVISSNDSGSVVNGPNASDVASLSGKSSDFSDVGVDSQMDGEEKETLVKDEEEDDIVQGEEDEDEDDFDFMEDEDDGMDEAFGL